MLLKGLPLPLGWLMEIVADSVQVVGEFHCDPKDLGWGFWTALLEVFWSHRDQCNQLHFTVMYK